MLDDIPFSPAGPRASFPDLFQGLNPAQAAAVEALEGPLLVLAGAGSGKTRVLTHRVAHFILSGLARPSEMLCLTFTNKAAKEMKLRVQSLLQRLAPYPVDASELWISTFHAVCARILRQHIDLIGYERTFTIYDSADQISAIKRVLTQMSIDEKLHPAKQFAAQINNAKTEGYTPDFQSAVAPNMAQRMDPLVAEVFIQYERDMKRTNALDFNDLLLKVDQLLVDYPDVLEYYQNRFRAILVDEYQDTNRIQYLLVKRLAANHQNICVVGDEDQSIYSWRGADIRNILDFEKDFSGAQMVKLEQNYRSSARIIKAAGQLISNNTQRKDKHLFTENPVGSPIVIREEANEYDEARFVVNQIQKLVDSGEHRLNEIAIFYRINAQSRVLEEQLRQRNLRYEIFGSVRFYDRMEVKDILSYFKVLNNPTDDVAMKRAIGAPTRGIGKTTIDRLDHLGTQRQAHLWKSIEHAIDHREFPPSTTSRLRGFIDLLQGLSVAARRLTLPELLVEVLERTGYTRKLREEGTPESESRLANLEELHNALSRFTEERGEEATLTSFLEEMSLVSDLDSEASSSPSVSMMTLHLSKGLEFPVVFVVGCEEGIFPSLRGGDADPLEIEEERRLCYVGMTRAEKRLFLTHARTRKFWGSDQMNKASRFFGELPTDCVDRQSSLTGHRPRLAAGAEPAHWSEDGSSRFSQRRSSGLANSPSRFVDQEFAQDFPDDFDQPTSSPTLIKGNRVRHPSYGVGEICAVEGSGDALKVTVAFPGISLKKFVAKYARLEKV